MSAGESVVVGTDSQAESWPSAGKQLGAPPPSQRKATLAMYVSQAALAAVNVPVTVILARTLAPAGLGEYQYLARLVLLAVSVGHLGIPHGLAWAVVRAESGSERAAVFRFALLAPIASGVCIFVLAGTLDAVGVVGDVPPIAWLAFALIPLFNLWSANVTGCLRGALLIRPLIAIRLAQGIAVLILMASLAILGELDIVSAAIANLVSQAAGALLALRTSRKLAVGAAWGTRLARADVWRFSRRVWPGLALRDWNLFFDQIVVKFYLGSREVGLYAVAVALSLGLTLLASPISATVQPAVQAAKQRGDELGACARAIVATFAMLAIPAALLAFLAPWLLPLVYGPSYAPAVAALQVLCVASAIEAYNFCLHGILLGLNRPGLSSISTVVGLAISVVCWVVLLPSLGIVGAALTSVVSYSAVNVLMTRGLLRALNCTGVQLFRQCLIVLTHPRQLIGAR